MIYYVFYKKNTKGKYYKKKKYGEKPTNYIEMDLNKFSID